MAKNTSIALGQHFEEFVYQKINEGRFKNASEVIRAGLRLLEFEEQKIIVLRKAIQDGIDSGIALDFDPSEHLNQLKKNRKKNV